MNDKKRVPRNFIPQLVLNEKQKELLNKILELYETNPYPPTVMDLVEDNYSSVLGRLYKLELNGWIRIDRERRRIRAIVPLMKP